MHKTAGMNRHQKAAHRRGELRVGRDQIDELLELARSPDAQERLEAAKWLCPCHVRRHIDAVWQALSGLLEDPDAAVRRAAWHTLEDGGRPDDPRLDAILDRVLATETDTRVLSFARQVAGSRRRQQDLDLQLAVRPVVRRRGKCDFCGESGVLVEPGYETTISEGVDARSALICSDCSIGSQVRAVRR